MSQPIDPTVEDRLLAAFRALVRAEFPQYVYLGVFEYVVAETDGVTISCSPIDDSLPLPSEVKIELRPSIAGESVTPSPAPGSTCLIMFANADPTKPVCISIAGPPVSVSIGAAPLPLARGPATVSALGLIATYIAAVTSAATANPAVYAPFATAIASAGSTLASAIAPQIAAVPTTVLKAT